MLSIPPDQHLSQITTLWTVVSQAHGENADIGTDARQRLLQRYGGAVKRYLHGVLRDPEAADELTQEFALRFMSGKYKGAERARGRFRNFVKGVLAHLIADHFRRLQAKRRLVALQDEELEATDRDPADPDPLFVESWRHVLLGRAWEALAAVEAQTGKPYHTVLRLRADRTDDRAAQLAEQLSARLGKPVSVVNLRQTLHRARNRFAELLLAEVVQTLGPANEQDLEQELIDLNLLVYCQGAMDERLGRIHRS